MFVNSFSVISHFAIYVNCRFDDEAIIKEELLHRSLMLTNDQYEMFEKNKWVLVFSFVYILHKLTTNKP